jgi:O-antigen/teichoic acid export membrane protein
MPGNGKITSRSFISSFSAVFAGQAGCALAAVGIEICYARLLGPAGRGQISLCLMAVGFAVLIGGLGCEIPIVIWSADSKRAPREWVASVMFWGILGSLLASGLWSLVYWRWHPLFLSGITSQLAILVLLSIPVSVFFGYFMAMLSGLERFGDRALIALVSQLSGFVFFGVLVLLLGRRIEFAILAELTGVLLATAMAAFRLRDVLVKFWRARPGLESLGAALGLGLRGQVGNMASFFSYRLDVFVVNYFLGPEGVGVYVLGVVISEALWQIPHAVAVALFPRTARTVEEGATEFTCHVIRQVLFIACATGVAIAVASPLLIPLVFGPKFSGSVAVVWWILPGTIALSLAKVMSSDLAARGKPEYSSIFSFLSLGTTIVLDFTLIPKMGINGAALASSAAYFVDSLCIAIALKHEMKITWKKMFTPSEMDWRVYRSLWMRARPFARTATSSIGEGGME